MRNELHFRSSAPQPSVEQFNDGKSACDDVQHVAGWQQRRRRDSKSDQAHSGERSGRGRTARNGMVGDQRAAPSARLGLDGLPESHQCWNGYFHSQIDQSLLPTDESHAAAACWLPGGNQSISVQEVDQSLEYPLVLGLLWAVRGVSEEFSRRIPTTAVRICRTAAI